jgi:ubiquinone/menaquinone biosynthesis C-methylase UbiE
MTTSYAKAFDLSAVSYDLDFTYSKTGYLQRQRVYHYLHDFLNEYGNQKKILEVNAGTGEDAIWLSSYCEHITVTDISQAMVDVASSKLKTIRHANVLTLNALDIQQLNQSYDFIFSNFAGLNCLEVDEFKSFITKAHQQLNSNGHLIMILLSTQCWWEKYWGFISNNKKLQKRRQLKHGANTEINGIQFNTYYYAPKKITEIAAPYFKEIDVKPIGLFIPPSFLEHRVKNKTILLKCLNLFDRLFFKLGLFSNYADHYLLHLQKQ